MIITVIRYMAAYHDKTCLTQFLLSCSWHRSNNSHLNLNERKPCRPIFSFRFLIGLRTRLVLLLRPYRGTYLYKYMYLLLAAHCLTIRLLIKWRLQLVCLVMWTPFSIVRSDHSVVSWTSHSSQFTFSHLNISCTHV